MASAKLQDGRILIIDDDVHVGSVFGDLLRKHGYAVQAMLSGEEGLRAIRADRPDVILLDVTMPDWDGLEVLEAIQHVDRSIPVIMVTATTDEQVCREAMRRGAYSWLNKPIDLAVLERFVTLALGRRRYRAIR